MRFGSLFAGIGGLDLGLERAGMVCKWQVEINEHATRVLEKHWPTVPRFRDVREVGGHNLESVDLICGGFPCQDVSEAGGRIGLGGARSGLWSEFYRIICELRPRFALVENVTGLFDRGFDAVLADLAAAGFDAEWETLSACAFGASHTRERVFIVAYSAGERGGQCGRIELAPGGLAERNIPVWPDQPEPVRVADGIPHRMDRLRGCGNAVVPQVAEWIGRRIVEHEFTLTTSLPTPRAHSDKANDTTSKSQ